MNTWTIIWELSLACNLNCSFCNQESRRKKQHKNLNLETARSIINHLPSGSHISFLWGETLLFPKFEIILELLQDKGISCEITTNGTLLLQNVGLIKRFGNITKVTVSLDGYGDFHDISRWLPGLFKRVMVALPHISEQVPVTVSTVITTQTHENLLRLHHTLPRLWVLEHRLIYCLQYSSETIQKTHTLLPEIRTSTPGNLNMDEHEYRKRFIFCVSLLRQHKHPDVHLFCEPDSTIIINPTKTNSYCKQIAEQFRIDESGKLSICGNILNHFADLTEVDFISAVAHPEYLNFKKKIQTLFPLSICETCCKRSIH